MLTEHPQFFTATILKWQHLLKPDKYKDVVMQSLQFLVRDKRILLFGFVIMPNHIHVIWQMQAGIKPASECATGFSEVYRPANQIRLTTKPPGRAGKVSGTSKRPLVSDLGTPAIIGAVVV